MAGKPYTVAKRWAAEKGLGFGSFRCSRTRPSSRPGQMDRCADVEGAGRNGAGGNLDGMGSQWSAYFRPLLAKAMVGEAPVDQVMKDGAERWNQMREQFANR